MCGLYLKYGAASYSQALHLTVCELEVIGGDLATAWTEENQLEVLLIDGNSLASIHAAMLINSLNTKILNPKLYL